MVEQELYYQHRDAHEDEEYTDLNAFLFQDLMKRCFTKVMDLKASYSLSEEPVPFAKKEGITYKDIKVGDRWADHVFQCAWFHLEGKLTKDVSTKNLCLSFDCAGEGLLVDEQGHALKGFTNGTFTFGQYNYPAWYKTKYPMTGLWKEDKGIDLYLDCGSNGLQGEFKNGVLNDASIVRENKGTEEVFYDFYVLLDYLKILPRGEDYLYLIHALHHVRDLYSYHFPNPDKEAKKILEDLLHSTRFPKDSFKYTAIGHAHLDLIWLWPERETHRKALRTFSNVIYLMKKYPDYTFAMSQPQQVEWVKEEDPKLFEEIKKYVKQGRIETVGGGWVENDTNLLGEESMARQELYGQKFWKENFGEYTHIRWLPDTFGYNGANPQVFLQSEENYFMTIKISWCDRTLFPYHTFYWEGIDKSKVLVHMPPEGDYNSLARPSNLFAGEKNMKPSDGKAEALLLFGVGDGGGGPGAIHVETIHREGDVSYLPNVKMGKAIDFFHDIDHQKGLKTYQGEMYLEKHRGTYTSQSENKQNNRHFEEKMKALEFLLAGKKIEEEKPEMDRLWKRGLFYQFHDSLPGSGIKRIYDEADIDYRKMFKDIEGIASRHDATFVPSEEKSLINHLSYSIRKFYKDKDNYLLYEGQAGDNITPVVLKKVKDLGNPSKVETEGLTIRFDKKDGHLLSVFDKKTKKNIVEEGNRLRVFMDTGDAWDFREDYRDQPIVYMTLEKRSATDYGEIIEIISEYTYQKSKVKETILIDKHRPWIEFHHDTDWKDVNHMLRAEFRPTEYSPVVHNDIQFGTLDRSTLNDTDHHQAQYEMCCQKWMDISSDTQGVSFLNATKNGYYAKEGIISLNLLRSTNYPCVDGDLKPTSYSYVLIPHEGGYNPIETDDRANELNACFLFANKPYEIPLSNNPDVEISAFKPSYDQKGYILRVYEKTGKKTKAEILLPNGMKIAHEVNLLEDKIGPATKEIALKPYQIRSFFVK